MGDATYLSYPTHVILSIAKDLYTSTLCIQILHFVQNDISLFVYSQKIFYLYTLKTKEAMNVQIEESWKQQLTSEFEKDYFVRLTDIVRQEYRTATIYPPGKLIFNSLNLCPFHQVKVVIIGQDPYHGPGQAHGLCFSVNDGVPFPPSLQNIFKEIKSDLGIEIPTTGNLTRWAEQGVLMLNATLTVRAHQAGSHQRKGWEEFTDAAIRALAEQREHLVFILWGAYAQKKGAFIDRNKHLVLASAHPSPLSAYNGFFGNKHFSRANNYLVEHGESPVNW